MADIELALLVDRLMRRIHTGLQSKAAEFDRERVGPNDGIILLTLAEIGQAEMNTLTKRLNRDKSQMTRSIRVLEDKGLVARQRSAEDGRVTLLDLTPKGKAVVETFGGAIAGTLSEVLGPLSEEEQLQLKAVLKRGLS